MASGWVGFGVHVGAGPAVSEFYAGVPVPETTARRLTARSMSLVRHTDPDAFALAARPMFARSEASGSTLLARATAMKMSPEPGDADAYLATYDGGGAFGVALRRGETPLMLEESDSLAAAAFAHDIAGRWPELSGVVGALDACEAFARVWRERTGRLHWLRFHLRHHQLTEVSPVPGVAGGSR